MHIIQQDSDYLVLKRYNSFWLHLILVSFFFTPFFIVPLFLIRTLIPGQQVLNCTRTRLNAVNCTIKEKTIFTNQKKISEIQLTEVSIIQEKVHEEGIPAYTLYQIQLKSITDIQNFGYSTKNKAEINEIDRDIKFFLDHPTQNNMEVQQRNIPSTSDIRFWTYWYIFFIVSFIIIISIPKHIIWHFDKNLYKLTVIHLSIFNQETVFEYFLTDQSKLEINSVEYNGYSSMELTLIIDSQERLVLPISGEIMIKNRFHIIGNFLDWHQESLNKNLNTGETQRYIFK